MTSFLLVIGSFLLGSLPFSVWLAKSASGLDLQKVGSGNPGATNVLRVAGKGPAAAALFLDVVKGALPVVAAGALDLGEPARALAGVAAILGHIASPFLGLRGGKGVATAAGALAVLSPLATLGGLFVFLAVLIWKRYVSLASMIAAGAIAALAALRVDDDFAGSVGALGAVVVAAIVIVRHRSNIERLLAGREPRVGEKVRQT